MNNPSSTNEYGSFYVFVKGSNPLSNKYVRYNFIYENDESINGEFYRVKEANYAERVGEYDFEVGKKLLQEGEIEMAIKEKGASDFIGGFHGDEIMNPSSLSLTVDGVELSLKEEGAAIGKKVVFTQDSTLNRCNTPDDEVISCERVYEVTKEGIALNQKATWLTDDFDIIDAHGSAFLAMFTPYRCTSSNERLLDVIEFYDENDNLCFTFDATDYGPGDSTTTSLIKAPIVTKAFQYGKTSGIEACVESQVVSGLTDRFAYIWVRQYNDNKIYFGSSAGVTPSLGDVWEVNNKYSIILKD